MPSSPGVGEAAALACALSWSLCAQFFGAAGLRIGSMAVNHVRLAVGLVALVVLHVVLLGSVFPFELPSRALMLLALSGIAGLSLGDACYFRALVLVGPATSAQVMTCAPVMALVLARIFLGERLSFVAMAGASVTIAGIALAIASRSRGGLVAVEGATRKALIAGLGFAFLGTCGQAAGLVLAKPALAVADPLSATLVRIAVGAVTLWGFTHALALVRRESPKWWAGARDRKALALTLAGTATGPVIGVWLSQIATKSSPVGIASTLMATVPLFVMAEDAIAGIRRPGPGEIIGAVVAVGGVAILMGGS